MNKRVVWILGTLATVVVFGLAALWLASPMAFGPAAYGMGPGMMSAGWASFTWVGLVFGLIHIGFWLLPIVLILTLLTRLNQPTAQEQDGLEA